MGMLMVVEADGGALAIIILAPGGRNGNDRG